MAELKPCPFCGKPARTLVILGAGQIALKVYCGGSCEAVSKYGRVEEYCSFDTIIREMDNAMCAWNRRAGNG